MIRFLLQRSLESLPLLVLLSLLMFALFDLIPGDYLTEMELNPSVPPERVAELRLRYGLNEPFYKQYFQWVSGVLQGELGYSFSQQRPASALIRERLLNTLALTFSSLLLTLALSLPLGVWAAFRPGSWPDRFSLSFSVVGLSLPTIITSLLLLYFAYWSGWFPIGGFGGLTHLILPSFTLALPMVAIIVRTLRLELIDVLDQPYMLAATAKGLSHSRFLYHALRNALNPVISIVGLILGGLLSGSVVVEKVFGWPGLGALTVTSILERDLFVAINCVMTASILIVSANFLADLALALNDPRVRGR